MILTLQELYTYLKERNIVSPEVWEIPADEQEMGVSMDEHLRLALDIEQHPNYFVVSEEGSANKQTVIFMNDQGIADYVADRVADMEDPDEGIKH